MTGMTGSDASMTVPTTRALDLTVVGVTHAPFADRHGDVHPTTPPPHSGLTP